jgi:hypothetical protein
MDTPNPEKEFRKLLEDIMNRDPMPELSQEEIKCYGQIGDARSW